ncbi:NAD-dependent epimerase/dehydratase family protein [Micromonospora sp. NPDC048843]|uniref:NAD-dependent epimerase/dehydratase family protein n=1 Tax=Micromonospora sp. NPDC048843 TaxID=3155389 RepID=UPI0033CA3EA6
MGHYIVTGGSGFVGTHLVAELVRHGHTVEVVDQVPPQIKDQNVTFVPLDLRVDEYRRKPRAAVVAIFHLAGNRSGPASVLDPRGDLMSNGVGSVAAGLMAYRVRAQRLIFLSTASVYGNPAGAVPIREEHPKNPILPYGASKLAAENTYLSMLRTHELPIVIGRSFAIYGPGDSVRGSFTEVDRFLRFALNEQPIQVLGDLDSKTRDFVHVTDVVKALLILGTDGVIGEAYNIASGVEISQRQLIKLLERVLKRKLSIAQKLHTTNDSFRFAGDIRKIRRLGFRPSVELAEGVSQLAKHYGTSARPPDEEVILRAPSAPHIIGGNS